MSLNVNILGLLRVVNYYYNCKELQNKCTFSNNILFKKKLYITHECFF